MNKMIVISCGRNCEKYVKKHMKSLNDQTFKDFKHLMIDDCSTDNTTREILKYGNDNTILFTNTKRQYWIANALKYLTPYIKTGDEIVVIVDMDDWLNGDRVLERVFDEYEKNLDCWMTYSRMMYSSSGRTSHWIPIYNIPILMDRSFRNVIWSFTHLRTFKGFLWKEIKNEDLLDQKGKYIKYAYDQAILLPMLEMSAPHHILFIPDVLYCYNDENPNQVEKNLRKEQEESARYIRSKRRYDRLIR